MWSDTKPIGDMTTAVVPASARSASTSLMSGSSQGCDGGPEREQNARLQSGDTPSSAATSCTTSRQASWCWAWYPGRAAAEPASIASGIECVTNSSGASAATSATGRPTCAASSVNASTTASALARTKPGSLK